MKKYLFFATLFTIIILIAGCASSNNSQLQVQKKSAEQILSEMTVEEKVGQIFLIEPDQFDSKFGNVKKYKYWTSVHSTSFNFHFDFVFV